METYFSRHFPEDIILQIFDLLLDSDDEDILDGLRGYSSDAEPEPSHHSQSPNTFTAIPLVCRKWHRLSIPILWRSLVLSSMSRTVAAISYLERAPYLKPLVKRLTLYHDARDVPSSETIHLLDLCTSIQAISYSANIPTHAVIDSITRLPMLKKLSLRLGIMTASCNAAWVYSPIISLTHRLTTLHISVPSPRLSQIIPIICALSIPHLRIECATQWLFPEDGGQVSPIFHMCQNPAVARIEICGTPEYFAMLLRTQRRRMEDEHLYFPRIVWYSGQGYAKWGRGMRESGGHDVKKSTSSGFDWKLL